MRASKGSLKTVLRTRKKPPMKTNSDFFLQSIGSMRDDILLICTDHTEGECISSLLLALYNIIISCYEEADDKISYIDNTFRKIRGSIDITETALRDGTK